VMVVSKAVRDGCRFGGTLYLGIRGTRRQSRDDRLASQDETMTSSLAAFLKSIPIADIRLTQFENPAYV
jgi:hypothetical protein